VQTLSSSHSVSTVQGAQVEGAISGWLASTSVVMESQPLPPPTTGPAGQPNQLFSAFMVAAVHETPVPLSSMLLLWATVALVAELMPVVLLSMRLHSKVTSEPLATLTPVPLLRIELCCVSARPFDWTRMPVAFPLSVLLVTSTAWLPVKSPPGNHWMPMFAPLTLLFE